ncbi:uncharacterized protein LOC114366737 [Ostrinia furnacalis]|uniref:uncharacterized protein LOC114366737 n=1 Tax=Ostrinia furnacalis TaxID=93504 RepID=UPI001040BDA6|nr:uncharacterized protein LOC114366737 [Ostrinia furnacalis]
MAFKRLKAGYILLISTSWIVFAMLVGNLQMKQHGKVLSHQRLHPNRWRQMTLLTPDSHELQEDNHEEACHHRILLQLYCGFEDSRVLLTCDEYRMVFSLCPRLERIKSISNFAKDRLLMFLESQTGPFKCSTLQQH